MEPGFELPFGACSQVLAQTLDNGESSVLQVKYRNMSARLHPLGKGEHKAIQRVVCRCTRGCKGRGIEKKLGGYATMQCGRKTSSNFWRT